MICAERDLKDYITDSPETPSFPAGNDLGEEGLYYFNARWYDPGLGRFITEDPVKDGINWFAYANNNPLRYIDPTGLRAVIGENVETGKLVTEDEYEPPEVTAAFRRSADSYDSIAGYYS